MNVVKFILFLFLFNFSILQEEEIDEDDRSTILFK